MATVLLTWELGSGYGHVASLSAIAKSLRQRGHHVVAALRDPTIGEGFFSSLGVPTVNAPVPAVKADLRSRSIATYADLLGNVGFNSAESLSNVIACWNHIYHDIEPDAVVFDHSPFALLAARNHRFAKLQHSTGFCIPPNTNPLPLLRPWLLKAQDDAARIERRLLETINLALDGCGQLPLTRLADLYYSTDDNWLATYEELDHFGNRNDKSAAHLNDGTLNSCLATSTASVCDVETSYQGITPPPTGGVRLPWPASEGPRVFAYLQPDSSTIGLLEKLGQMGVPTIARVAGLRLPDSLRKYQGTLRVVSDAVDIGWASRECDLAVLSGGHGTVAAMLLAGKPVILAPIQLEQLLLARCCERAGVGIGVPCVDVKYFANAVHHIAKNPRYLHNAQRFSARYSSLDQHDQLAAFAARIEQLIESR